MRRKGSRWILFGIMVFLMAAVLPCGAAEDTKASKEGAASPPSAQEQPKPHPGRDAPLWEKGDKVRMDQMPPIRKITDGVLAIDKIRIDKNIQMVTLPGVVNMQEGLVEYLACGARGKLHESILRIDVEPFYIQVAMLLIGLEPGKKALSRQGEAAMPEGDPADIEVQWMDEHKKRKTFRAEDLVFNQQTKKSMQHTNWVFTGSKFMNGRFMAQVEHSVVALYHDPFALFDHPLSEGADDRVFFANKEILPPKGTPVTVVIRPIGNPDQNGRPLPGRMDHRPRPNR